ncbi:hypothetical protein CEXT_465121 [Caerostris extrusa]|uniref:Secreted protein n=1 Tax=Caerostris extrusa TaxID=172846 RepID=A0AAV4MAL4_CAEEX|nr:hypothetical protein CEXT_465121 [Caerostris extrusa]
MKKGRKKKFRVRFCMFALIPKAAHSMMKITTVSSLRFVTSIGPPASLIRTLGYRKRRNSQSRHRQPAAKNKKLKAASKEEKNWHLVLNVAVFTEVP